MIKEHNNYEMVDCTLKRERFRKRKEFDYWFTGIYDEFFIRNNLDIDDINLNLSLISHEYVTLHGRIDILCEDNHGNKVPIEVKKNMADDRSIGQILGYMKSLNSKYGIVIAKKFSKRLIYIANDYNIKLFYYTIDKIGDKYDGESKDNQFVIKLDNYIPDDKA